MIEALLPYIVGALALLGALFGYGRVQRNKGQRDVEEKITKDALESIRKANANREQVSTIDDLPSEFDRLHKERRR